MNDMKNWRYTVYRTLKDVVGVLFEDTLSGDTQYVKN